MWCHHLSTNEGAVNRIFFMPASCERLSIPNRIMPLRCRHENCLKTVWNENGMYIGYETKTEPFLSSYEHPMPVGFDDGATSRLISQWNRAGTMWCHHLSTNEGAVNIIFFMPASCERLSIPNRIMPLTG